MRTSAPPPTFRGKPVLVGFNAKVKNSGLVSASIAGIVRAAEDMGWTEEELVTWILARVAAYRGLVAQLVPSHADAITISIERR